MAAKTRLQGPYGYRETNDYVSEPHMICQAINNIKLDSKCKDKEIADHAFFGVNYDKDLSSFVFLNSGGTMVGVAKMKEVIFSDLLKSSTYDANSKKIVFTFENGDVIDVDVKDLTNNDSFGDGFEIVSVDNARNIKIKINKDSEEYLTLSSDGLGIKLSGVTDAIAAEAKAREDADNVLDNKISNLSNTVEEKTNELTNKVDFVAQSLTLEIEQREKSDNDIWDAIGTVSSITSGSSATLAELLKKEIEDRAFSDNQLILAIENEADNRAHSDEDIWDAIGEVSAITSGETSLLAIIRKEQADREDADKVLDSKIDECVLKEQTDRIYADKAQDKVIEEINNNLVTSVNTINKNVNEGFAVVNTAVGNNATAIQDLYAQLEANKVKIEKVTDGLDTTVREEYKLTKTNGEQLGETIKIYKDSSIISIELVDEDDKGTKGQFLKYTYYDTESKIQSVYVNVSAFLVESEFKNGFDVNASTGVINVKIDPTSDEYLTVGENGVKLSNVKAKFDSLDAELAKSGETMDALHQLIMSSVNDEIEARKEGDSNLQEAMLANLAKIVELSGTVETKAAISSLLEEISDRTNADLELTKNINTVSANTETVSTKVDVLTSSLNDEIKERKNSDELITDLISANRTDIDANKTNIESLNSSKADATALETEISDRKTADNELSDRVKTLEGDIYVRTVSAKDNTVDVTTADENVTVGVKLDTDTNNLVKVSDNGINANVNLEYDSTSNVLIFTSSALSEEKRLKLNAPEKFDIVSLDYINSISDNSYILRIGYQVDGGATQYKTVDIASILSKINVSNTLGSPVVLNMDTAHTITADITVATAHTDNVLVKDGNALYVSKNDIIGELTSTIAALTSRVTVLEEKIKNLSSTASTQNLNSSVRSIADDSDFFDLE